MAKETRKTELYSVIPRGSFRTTAPDRIPTIGVSITPIVAIPTGYIRTTSIYAQKQNAAAMKAL